MCFLRLWKENEAANTHTRHILETVIITYDDKYPLLPPGVYAFYHLCLCWLLGTSVLEQAIWHLNVLMPLAGTRCYRPGESG
jgi:hypothetical protein